LNNACFNDLKGARCRVFGLGKSNEALISYLDKKGAEIYVSDKRKSENEITDVLQNKGIKKARVLPYLDTVNTDFVFRTPSLRPDAPEILSSTSSGAFLTSEVELFFEVAKGKIYGITGSDGKTTTTTLTYEILKRQFGKDNTFVGGNIGIPLISFADKLNDESITVCELSSFQLMTVKRSPNFSAITNISENHLDYHLDMAEYIGAKCRIAEYGCKRLVAYDKAFNYVKSYAKRLPKDVVFTSFEPINRGVNAYNGYICKNGEKILPIGEIKVPGKYNIANFMTALGLTDAPSEVIGAVARVFKGVEHRNELVCQKRGISFYNASIDSTPSRTLATLSCHANEDITLILGGYDKNLDYSELAKHLNNAVKRVVMVGENKNKIKSAIDSYAGKDIKVYMCEDFKEAVMIACDASRQGSTVLLSPASASFDMFNDFEHRGNTFKNIINQL